MEREREPAEPSIVTVKATSRGEAPAVGAAKREPADPSIVMANEVPACRAKSTRVWRCGRR